MLLLLLLLSRFSRVQLCATPETAAHQASPSLGFSRQERWSGLPFPSPVHESEKWKWSRSVVADSATPWTAAFQAPSSMGFPRQEYWSGLPLPSPILHGEVKWSEVKWSRSVMSDSLQPHGLWPTMLLHPWDFPGKSTGVGCHNLTKVFSSPRAVSPWESPFLVNDLSTQIVVRRSQESFLSTLFHFLHPINHQVLSILLTKWTLALNISLSIHCPFHAHQIFTNLQLSHKK